MDIIEYKKKTNLELREELINVCGDLAAAHTELAIVTAEHNREYNKSYVQSPGNSVSAKEHEADYNTQQISRDIMHIKADIERLTLACSLIRFLLNG